MRKLEFFFLCISLLIVFSTFSVSYAHEKPAVPAEQNSQASGSTSQSQENSASAQDDQHVSSSSQQNSAASSGQSIGQDSSASSTSSSTQQAQGTASGQTSASSSLEAQGAASGQIGAQGTATGQTDTTQQSQGFFSASGSASATFKGQFTKVFAFGDSFTDTGNAASLEGVKPFGHLPFAKPGHLPGHRMSNGKLLIDFLCEDLGLPSIKAYKDASGDFSSGANFAVAGSTCLASKFFSTHKMLHSLMFKQKPENALIQIDWFNNFLLNAECKGLDEAQCKAHLSHCLFWVGALGLSDYARIIGSAIAGKSLTEASVDHVCKILKDLLDKGAKYVVVQGLPPAGCCPLQMLLNPPRERDSMGCSSGLNALIQAHNEVLEQRLVEFREQYQGTVIIYADTWKAYKTIMLNHKKFHFEEPFKACCGAGGGPLNFDLHSLCGSSGTSVCKNPQNFISWDGIHYTEAMHKRLFDMFVHQGFCSPSFDVLIQAKMKGGLAQGAGAFAAKGITKGAGAAFAAKGITKGAGAAFAAKGITKGAGAAFAASGVGVGAAGAGAAGAGAAIAARHAARAAAVKGMTKGMLGHKLLI